MPDLFKGLELNSVQARQEFQAKNFVKALEFTNKLRAIAKAENHHPLIVVK